MSSLNLSNLSEASRRLRNAPLIGSSLETIGVTGSGSPAFATDECKHSWPFNWLSARLVACYQTTRSQPDSIRCNSIIEKRCHGAYCVDAGAIVLPGYLRTIFTLSAQLSSRPSPLLPVQLHVAPGDAGGAGSVPVLDKQLSRRRTNKQIIQRIQRQTYSEEHVAVCAERRRCRIAPHRRPQTAF